MKLSEGIDEYVTRKRAAGLIYLSEACMLNAFLRNIGDCEMSEITASDVLLFLNCRPAVSNSWLRKYRLLMHLFEFWTLREIMPELVVLQQRVMVRANFVPHIYSREQVDALMRATRKSKWRSDSMIHPRTFRMLFLILYGTGATRGEALAIETKDIDFKLGWLTMRRSHRSLSRRVPICSDLLAALRNYLAWRSKIAPHSDRFLIRNDGFALKSGAVIIKFQRLRRIADIRRNDGLPDEPTMQDFRATFAVHRITSWIKGRADLNRLLPALAVYMGHVGLGSTQKYLFMTPERFRRELNKLSTVHRKGQWRSDPGLMRFLAGL